MPSDSPDWPGQELEGAESPDARKLRVELEEGSSIMPWLVPALMIVIFLVFVALVVLLIS